MIDEATLPDFEAFGFEDAWRIGVDLVQRCRADALPVVIVITLGERRAFHASLPGASADNDAWADRKARIVRRFDKSSAAVAEHYGVTQGNEFYEAFGLDRRDFAAAEGAVPIRVSGTQVGVLAISGLETGGDHDLAVSGLRRAGPDVRTPAVR